MAIVDPYWPRASVWLNREDPDPEVLVVGVPSSKASLSPSAADRAPMEVRHRFDRFSTFHGELGVDFEGVRVRDLGNWAVSQLDPTTMIAEVTRLAQDLPAAGMRLYIGGDNAITRPLVAAMSDDLMSVGLITFDAHHDVRSLENGPSNGTPIRGLIEEHGLPGANVVQIGIHSFANSAAYRAYCDDQGVTTVTVTEVEHGGMESVVRDALNRLSDCERIYVDVDIDVLDRVFAPACPGARPGGLTVRQLATGLATCAADPRVTAFDFVEVDPTADVGAVTLDVTAHLILTAVAGYATR
ncbi:MAG TPA: arginase family protein [Acidimicrobiia bacterium]|jgi:formimidoylglutamase|nr:arginase family protein [Acidimicrobiia bacterium]